MSGAPCQNCDSRLLIVDDHGLVRDGLLALFRAEGGFEVVAVDAGEAVRTACYFSPHVVLMDLTLPGSFAFLAARSIRSENGLPRLLFLDDTVRPANVGRALEFGICGYWTKHASFDQLAAAVRCIVSGRMSFCPEVEPHLVAEPEGLQFRPSADVWGTPDLTARQREVLALLARGLSVKECAQRMGLSQSTVDNQKSRLMRKLGVHCTVDLVWIAFREGLVGE